MVIMTLKSIVFDLIGTLIHIKPKKDLMVQSLKERVYNEGVAGQNFDMIYQKIFEKHQRTRVSELKEIDNCTLISQVLDEMGAHHFKQSITLRCVSAYFKPYLDSIMILKGTREVLKNLSIKYSLGIITNFTCSNIVRRALKKTRISDYFNHVIISCEEGWRKPHPAIFNAYLKKTKLEADEIALVGDDPIRDIQGARNIGMKTILIKTGITPTEDYYHYGETPISKVKPDYEITTLKDLPCTIRKIV